MICEKEQHTRKGEHKIVEQQQQNRLPHYRVKQLRLAQLLRLIANTRLEGVPKGIIVIGTCGIGKTIGVVTYLQIEKH